jgi:hydroxyacylglutathione hydrolase
MKIFCHENGPFGVNTYLVMNESNKRAFIIDPGSNDLKILLDGIAKEGYSLESIVCTHGHIDHVAGIPFIKKRFRIPFFMCDLDREILETVSLQARMFGVPDPGKLTVDQMIPTSGTISFCDIQFTILHTPGHSQGSVSFYHDGTVFVGDALFNMSIGRTDLPGGHYEQLIHSIEHLLFPLPDDTRVLCGHGPETTIGFEKNMNPFFS